MKRLSTLNIEKVPNQMIDSASEQDIKLVIERMQGIIDEGSDYIKELKSKIKSQGEL